MSGIVSTKGSEGIVLEIWFGEELRSRMIGEEAKSVVKESVGIVSSTAFGGSLST